MNDNRSEDCIAVITEYAIGQLPILIHVYIYILHLC